MRSLENHGNHWLFSMSKDPLPQKHPVRIALKSHSMNNRIITVIKNKFPTLSLFSPFVNNLLRSEEDVDGFGTHVGCWMLSAFAHAPVPSLYKNLPEAIRDIESLIV